MKKRSHCFDTSSRTVQYVPSYVSDYHIPLTTKKEIKVYILDRSSKSSFT